MTRSTLSLVLVGYGHVARRFVQLLAESRPALAALDIHYAICGVATRRRGTAFQEAGLDPDAIDGAFRPAAFGADGAVPFIADALGHLRRRPYTVPVLVETTTLDVRSGEPAISHVQAALDSGADVITANKGPIAIAYRSLAAAAARDERSFLFEGAVMDGLPIFNLVRETMPAVEVTAFRGVVNSTTNYMLTSMERGESFDAALARMQAAGVAEADASLDVDGWDAAAKAAALANVWLDAGTSPAAIHREGIGPATGARAIEAQARGRRLKLVAHGSGRGADARVRVELQELDRDDPLAILDGQANALEISTWPLGRVVVTQRDGGLEKTAYALLSDLVTVARRHSVRSRS